VDPLGLVPVETILDAASLVDSVVSMANEPSWANAGFLAWDVAGTLIPYVPGAWVAKGGKYASKLKKAEEVGEASADSVKVVGKSEKTAGKGAKEAEQEAGQQAEKKTEQASEGAVKDTAETGVDKVKNEGEGAVQNSSADKNNGVIAVDPQGNAMPLKPGQKIEGRPDGKMWQVKDKDGNPTGDRYDGLGHPKQSDPKAQAPHAHRVGSDGQPIKDEVGNPHLPANPPKEKD